MSPLDAKLLRDLWRIKTQAFAISMVIAVGVMLLVMMDGMVNSLAQTREAYYDRYRLADVFAPATRAPRHVLDEIAAINGVAAVEGRVVGGALVNIEGQAAPVRAQAVSLPDFKTPRLNDIYLAEGRMLNASHRDEVILLEGFAKAHGLGPGDQLSATMYGARRTFKIVGLAQAPEFLYTTAPGELVPDDSRFTVLWMSEDALEAAFDLKGAFNEALVALERGAQEKAVIASIDRILDSYGGLGAYGLIDLFSDRFIVEEINQSRVSSRIVPPLFMGVASFLLYIVISRIVSAERMQIGLLKAFGYSSVEIGAHYFKLVMVIALTGAAIGCALGVWSGHSLASYYQVYYKFPFLLFRVDPAAFITAVTISVLTAAAGGVIVLRRVFGLAPAVAMRPPAPADYSSTASLFSALRRYLDQPSRMVIRRILRQPGRAFMAVMGIAAGMGLSVSTLGVMEGFDRAINLNFAVVDRSDAVVSFVEPRGLEAISDLERMNGVIEVEPFRSVSVILRNGVKTHRTAISGLVSEPRLNRAMTDDLEPIFIRSDGVILSTPLLDKLGLKPGDMITIDVREGRRPVLTAPVVGSASTLLGAPAFMEVGALNRLLKEDGRSSGAYLRIDADRADEIYEELKDMPIVAGVSLSADAEAAFRKIMDQGAGATRFIMAGVAGLITFGIVFNSARIAFAERSHDLASLRVIGFTKGEAAFVLLGELALIVLAAIPIGVLIGLALAEAMAAGFSNDLYTIPALISPTSIGYASLAVLISSLVSGLMVKRDVDRLDLIAALKSRE